MGNREGRSTIYHDGLVTPEKWEKVCDKNKTLLNKYIKQCKVNLSPQTVYQYESQLKLFFCWNLENNDDVFFIELKKRHFLEYISYLVNDLEESPQRVSTLKSALSAFSNYIEAFMDEDYPSFKNIVKLIPIPKKTSVREKTILTEEDFNLCVEKLTAAKRFDILCCFALSLASGMRKAELLQMKVSFFTPEHIVLDTFYKTEKIRTKGSGKIGKQIEKFVFIEEFQPYFDLWMKRREELGITSDYLFVVKRGGEYVPASIPTMNSWAEKIEKIIDKPFYFHCSRHKWNTEARSKNGKNLPDSVIATLQGWSTIGMVEHYDDAPQEEKLAEYFGAGAVSDKKE